MIECEPTAKGSTAATSCGSARPACLGLRLADVLRLRATAGAATPAAKKPATGVIQIWLSGGPATIDMWDLKPDAPEEIRGEFRPIATATPGVSIGEHMPGLAKVMDRCVLIRSLGHTISAHGPGTTYMSTGNRPSAAMEYPALGSLAARAAAVAAGRAAVRHVRGDAGGRADDRRGLPRPGVRPVRGRGRARPGHSRGARGLAAGGDVAPRPGGPRRVASRARSRPAGTRRHRPHDGPRRFHREAVEILRSDRVRSRSTWRASRTGSATTTAGPRWGRGPWPPAG